MSCIQEIIQTIPGDRVAFADAHSKYSYNELIGLYQNNIEIINVLKGSSIAINGRGRLEFALLLSILDGHVKKILFLPSDIDSSLHGQYYKEAGINFEVHLENNILHSVEINSVAKQINNKDLLTQWIVPTSGTTNIPKLVSHTFSSLTRTAKTNVELGGKYRWGLVFDIYRFSGIQVFLQAILSGSTLIITDPTQSMSKMLTQLADAKCNALSATPSFWRKTLMTKESDNLQLRRITLGGEISDNNILKALKQKFPQTRIIHIYASTEVGVGFSVTDGKEGFPATYLDGARDAIKIKIDNDGLLWIAPENKDQQYLSKDDMYDESGYINTGDLVELKEDRVYFLGRDSGAINVGGNKVQPEEVEITLLGVCRTHPSKRG